MAGLEPNINRSELDQMLNTLNTEVPIKLRYLKPQYGLDFQLTNWLWHIPSYTIIIIIMLGVCGLFLFLKWRNRQHQAIENTPVVHYHVSQSDDLEALKPERVYSME
jgi:hypothetical protein